jgi:hypothetical protein
MAVLLECAACFQNYAVPKEASAPPACPWCGAVSASDRTPISAGAFPQLTASRFPRRRRTLPALVWLVVGVGLGACVVLSVLVVRGSPDPAQGPDRRSPLSDRVGRESAVAAVARPGDGDTTGSQARDTTGSGDRATTEAVVRQLVREEMNRTMAAEPREPAKSTTARWLSNRPPPIGDPEDDSPGLGLMLRQREPERLGSPPSSLDSNDRDPPERKTPPPTRSQNDPAAVSALAAAGIRCDKDANTGLVTRIDGSFRMTDALMPHVAKLPGLNHLKLSFAEITDVGLTHVKDLTDLRELILNQTKVTDAGFAHLEKLVKLEKLDLEKTLVSDEGLAGFQKLERLKHLDLRGTKITPSGVGGLKAALPSAKIRY